MSVALQDVSVSYSTSAGTQVDAVRSVNVTINRGEFVILLGPSGCGKSTILHCMGGLMKPTSGQVTYDGGVLRAPDPHRAAFVFQDYALLPWRSVIDNAAIGLRFAGVSRKERHARATRYLEMVGLAAYADALPGELSGGMQQRVAVARALTMDPEVLLLDEPFGAVDEQSRRRLGVEMTQLLTAAGQTTVMVTHSLDEAVFWADRVLLISARPGTIVEEIRVEASRPRDMSFMMTEEFKALHSTLFGLLEKEADLQRSAAAGGSRG
jgi:NitT/TauT family transport system ATP-binding protein